MTHKEWTLQPGERYSIEKRMDTVIENYNNKHRDKNIVTSNENEDAIYFMLFDTDGIIVDADVALLYRGEYMFLPKNTAVTIARSYMHHAKLLGDAYEYLEENLS